MKKFLLLGILSCFAIILSACGPKVVEKNVEVTTPSGDIENIIENKIEDKEEISTEPSVDLSKLSVKHDVDYKMGTIEDPVKIGEYGRGTSLVFDSEDKSTYGYDIYIKITGRMTDEEVDDFMNYFRETYPEKEINEDFVFMGVNCEVDFNGIPDLADYLSLGMDTRLDSLPVISVESNRFNAINGMLIKSTVDDEHLEDNHFRIVFSQFKEKDEQPLLKVLCFDGSTNARENECYCYYEI